MTEPARPILRYHGGKWRLAPWLISHMPRHKVYVEPYCGAASVLMRKPRATGEVLNDLNADIVNVFRVLRDPEEAKELRRLCELTPFARDEFWLCYEPTPDPVERARRTIFKSFSSHGSTNQRKNGTGFRATAFRQRMGEPVVWAGWPRQVPAFVERLRGVVLESRPALEIIAQQDTPRTLFYLDPPYPHSTRSSIRWPCDVGRAYVHDMTDDDHLKLADVLSSVEGMVLISGYRCELYDELYAGWRREEKATFADHGKPRTEALWMNEAAVKGQAPTLFDGRARG